MGVLDDELVPGEGVGPRVRLAPTRPAPTSNDTSVYTIPQFLLHPTISAAGHKATRSGVFFYQATKRPGREFFFTIFYHYKEKTIDKCIRVVELW